jgi:hypothetical protein
MDDFPAQTAAYPTAVCCKIIDTKPGEGEHKCDDQSDEVI